jgi:hypothetical protein
LSFSSEEDSLLSEEKEAVEQAKLTNNHVSKRSDYYINDMKYYSSGPASAFPLPFQLSASIHFNPDSKNPVSKESLVEKDSEDVYPLSKKYDKYKDRRIILEYKTRVFC